MAPGRLVVVRHGETEWSAAKRHTGRTDIELTPTGEAQATALRLVLARLQPVAVVSSPRVRAVRTAELLGHEPVVDDDLAEWDYGDYEGLTTEEIRESVPGWTVWSHACPGGETAEQVAARCDSFLARTSPVLERGDVLVVAHGHLLRVLTARWLDRPAAEGGRLALGTATVGVLGEEHDSPVVARWNIPNPTEDQL